VRRFRLYLSTLLLCAAVLAPAQAQDELAEVRAEWAAKIARDARIGFVQRSAGLALADVLEADVSPQKRAAALLALGGSGAVSERPRLSAWAVEGNPVERQAAILALGELGRSGPGRLGTASTLLVDLLSDPDPLIAECALLALLRTNEAGWRELAEGIAAERSHRLSTIAPVLIGFIGFPGGSQPSRAAARLLDWRWDAGRAYGTIDTKAWSITLIEGLQENDEFLDHLIYRSAARLAGTSIRDHLVQLLLTHGGQAVVRAAVRTMSHEVEQIIAADLWTPSDEEWFALVDEASRAGGDIFLPLALERAARQRMVAPIAAGLMVQRDRRYLDVILSALQAPEPLLRVRAARAVADGNLADSIPLLAELEADPDTRVRAAALVARVRLGDSFAAYTLTRYLAGEIDEEATAADEEPADAELLEPVEVDFEEPEPVEGREDYYAELTEYYWAIDSIGIFFELADALEGRERADMLACLHLRGQRSELEALRESFDEIDPRSPTMRRVLRALGQNSRPEDVEFLASIFPFEDYADANLEIAIALLENGHAKVRPILQRAVWSGPWNRSVLAAALGREAWGMRILLYWVTKPPAYATSADIRRLGFAIGELGGMEGLEELTKRIGAGSDRPALQGALLGALVARTH